MSICGLWEVQIWTYYVQADLEGLVLRVLAHFKGNDVKDAQSDMTKFRKPNNIGQRVPKKLNP